jgi:NADH-quinone oxidoreductase subunit F
VSLPDEPGRDGTVGFLLPESPVPSLEAYLAAGGGEGLERARTIGPERTIEELSLARLRGRGGAGFPTSTKWRSVLQGGSGERYAVCNAAEGEPGTFKDRALLRADPYPVIEGLLIAAATVGAVEAFVALKASFTRERERVEAAIAEFAEVGMIEGLRVTVVSGPEEYLFGEEKALLEVIEGNEPLPRWLPPYQHGLFVTAPQLGWAAHEPEQGQPASGAANPTLVNNAETLADVAYIVARGPEWFRSMGTAESPGTVLCTVTGDVQRAGVFEVAMGTPLRHVIDLAGGPPSGRSVRAVFSGVSTAVLTGGQIDTPLTYEALRGVGAGLGSAGFLVYDDTACLLAVAQMVSRFLFVESCGQCPPCKLGTGAITEALDRIAAGGPDDDLGRIAERLRTVTDASRCYLPAQEQAVIASILRAFPEDVADHLEGTCNRRHDPVIPKLVDLAADGTVTYDPDQPRKQPDWTYAV